MQRFVERDGQVNYGFKSRPATTLSARLNLPASVHGSFQGTAQAFQEAQAGLLVLLVMAILVIYLVLGILYESFIHPLTILADNIAVLIQRECVQQRVIVIELARSWREVDDEPLKAESPGIQVAIINRRNILQPEEKLAHIRERHAPMRRRPFDRAPRCAGSTGAP
mgnify:CR=1 FL=1